MFADATCLAFLILALHRGSSVCCSWNHSGCLILMCLIALCIFHGS